MFICNILFQEIIDLDTLEQLEQDLMADELTSSNDSPPQPSSPPAKGDWWYFEHYNNISLIFITNLLYAMCYEFMPYSNQFVNIQ